MISAGYCWGCRWPLCWAGWPRAWTCASCALENRQAPKAYFKGLNFLLNEQQDQAIDAFIEAVQNDPDTSELHFALGNLFRRRGEYERAVRVHEHLLSRGDLGRSRPRTRPARAGAGLPEGGPAGPRRRRPAQASKAPPLKSEARLALLAIYERSRDWPHAAAIASQMQSAGQGNFGTRQAHYLCEQAQSMWRTATLTTHACCWTRLAPVRQKPRGHASSWPGWRRPKANLTPPFEMLKALATEAPAALPLAATLLVKTAQASGQTAQALELLQRHYSVAPSLDVLDAIVALTTPAGSQAMEGREWYLRHLEAEPSLVAAAKWMAGERLEHEQFHPQVQRALDHAAQPLTRYRCAACGFEARQHFWQCPGCQTWDSYPARRVEEL